MHEAVNKQYSNEMMAWGLDWTHFWNNHTTKTLFFK